MKQIIYLLIFLLLTNCDQVNSENTVITSEFISGINDKTEQEQLTYQTILDSSEATVQEKVKRMQDDYNPDEYRKRSLNHSFEQATLYQLTDSIIADFNGDGILDTAILKTEEETSGIIIKHGQTQEEFYIGFRKAFGGWDDFDCNWVDYWALVEDRETSEMILGDNGDILDAQAVKLRQVSIFLAKDDVGGGLITFRNGKYEWIHQTC